MPLQITESELFGLSILTLGTLSCGVTVAFIGVKKQWSLMHSIFNALLTILSLLYILLALHLIIEKERSIIESLIASIAIMILYFPISIIVSIPTVIGTVFAHKKFLKKKNL